MLAALVAIIRNIGGALYNYIESKIKGTEFVYSAKELAFTLALYETFFLAVTAVTANNNLALVLTVIVDVVRSFREKIASSLAEA